MKNYLDSRLEIVEEAKKDFYVGGDHHIFVGAYIDDVSELVKRLKQACAAMRSAKGIYWNLMADELESAPRN